MGGVALCSTEKFKRVPSPLLDLERPELAGESGGMVVDKGSILLQYNPSPS